MRGLQYLCSGPIEGRATTDDWYCNLKICIYYVDINECSDDNGGCDHTCTNIVGSYSCGCNDGYELDTDEHTCIGI